LGCFTITLYKLYHCFNGNCIQLASTSCLLYTGVVTGEQVPTLYLGDGGFGICRNAKSLWKGVVVRFGRQSIELA